MSGAMAEPLAVCLQGGWHYLLSAGVALRSLLSQEHLAVFSRIWLANFRYGPMEWLWRGFTYRQVPPLRIAPAGEPTPAPTPAA